MVDDDVAGLGVGAPLASSSDGDCDLYPQRDLAGTPATRNFHLRRDLHLQRDLAVSPMARDLFLQAPSMSPTTPSQI
ncbi:hypothetical protein TIFTF001_008995 [Ficus carica]|uniref:Uncharacterized protein n=1 Tax=Ficus carica TaxID=3494 RepID=A0AA87ZP13_FICCA|nr:hypothetical protein TIFTF001_008995 [Ficus carica]